MSEEAPDPETNVVRLSDVVKWGHKPRECNHQRFFVDPVNRRVTCRDCEREVEPIEAMIVIASDASLYQSTVDNLLKEKRLIEGYAPRLRAVRELESIWRGKSIPCCPHCRKGVTAEALLAAPTTSRVFAEALEKHEREKIVAAKVAETKGDDAS